MTYADPITWVDDDGSGTTGTALSAAHENERERILTVLANAGIAGANLLPDFDSAWWASGGSGIVNTFDVGTPYRIRTGADKTPGKILLCSVQTNATNFLAALNPAASYLWLEPGKTYSWGVWLRSETIARDFRIRSIFFQENGTTQIATPGGEYTALVTSVVGDWIHIVRTVTAPAAAAGQEYVRFRPYVYVNTPNGSAGSPELVYLTEPVLVEGEVVPNYSKSAIDLLAAIGLKQDAAGELDAISALTLAADRLVYFTGPAAANAVQFLAWARTFISAANVAAAQAALGVDAAGTARPPTAHGHPISDVTSLQAALDAKAAVAQEAVRVVGAGGQPVFTGGKWQAKDATRSQPSFYKDTTGRVHLQGVITPAVNNVANTPMFTLPAGYLPLDNKEHWFSVYTTTGIQRMEVSGSGVVNPPFAANVGGDVSLDGISFRAA